MSSEGVNTTPAQTQQDVMDAFAVEIAAAQASAIPTVVAFQEQAATFQETHNVTVGRDVTAGQPSSNPTGSVHSPVDLLKEGGSTG